MIEIKFAEILVMVAMSNNKYLRKYLILKNFKNMGPINRNGKIISGGM